MTRHCSWLVLWALGCSAAAPSHARSPGPPQATKSLETPEQKLECAQKQFEHSDYEAAETAFRELSAESCCGEPAKLGLAELLLVRGRYPEALQLAQSLSSARATRVVVGALTALDRAPEAQSTLQAALSDPALTDVEKRPLVVLLGQLLIDSGQREAAKPVLMQLIEAYNDDRIHDDDGPGMFAVAQAAELLRSPEDANDAYNLAEQALGYDLELLLARARLFLANYDPGHAEEVVQDILDHAPNQPDALVTLAEVRLDQALDFGAAKELAQRALKVNPAHARAHFVLAGVALRDMQLERVFELTSQGLQLSPGNLELASMRAAAQFLGDDDAGFEQTQSEVFARNGQYSQFYDIVSEYAEWEHRYQKVVEMMRQAVAIDPDDAKAHAQLGLNLIRAGDEQSGVESLRRAFAKDPFNVRVHNTLHLYEEIIPSDYESESHGKFEFRFSKVEQPVLSREVPKLIERAWGKMVQYYGFEPQTPVGIELYYDRKHFAVRTSGLPQIAIQGVCFGRTLASMSPQNEQFNLGMTLWHELAHVFHIQLSHSHVPRWFTEGLAEYETLVERPEWKRERDADLFVAFHEHRLPKIAAMNEAFTHADNLADVTVAYYASTQIVTMLAEQFGRPKLRDMLVAWGRGERHEQVFQGVLGVSSAQLDERFEAFLDKRLARFRGQYQPPSTAGSAEASQKPVHEQPTDPKGLTRLAWRQLQEGDFDAAKATLDRALELEPANPDALWVKANLALHDKDPASALFSAQQLVETGHDGFEVQALIARAADPDTQGAVFDAALERAHELDPERAEPLYALLQRATARKDSSAELRWLMALAPLVEHDGDVQRRLSELLLESGELEPARVAAQSAVYADMEQPASYIALARVLERMNRVDEAETAWQSAVVCPAQADVIAQAHEEFAGFYERHGKRALSRKQKSEAEALRRAAAP